MTCKSVTPLLIRCLLVTVTAMNSFVAQATGMLPDTPLLVISEAVATVNISDTKDLVTVSIAADGDVNEATAASFTVSVSQALDSNLEVTLNNGDTVTITAGNLSVARWR